MRFHEKSCQNRAAQCNSEVDSKIFRENRLTFLIWRNFEPKFVLPLVSSKSVSYEQGLVYGYMGVRKLHSGQCCRILGYSVSLSLVTSSGFEAIETIRKLEAESKLIFFWPKWTLLSSGWGAWKINWIVIPIDPKPEKKHVICLKLQR